MMPAPLLLVIFVALVIYIAPAAVSTDIKKFVYNINEFGAYSFEYETSDGSYRKEDGGLKSQHDGYGVRGEYGYVDPIGRRHLVRYIADVNGFQPQFLSDDSRFNDRRII
nr:cuticle protein CP14.6-like [Plodia interpunctella]